MRFFGLLQRVEEPGNPIVLSRDLACVTCAVVARLSSVLLRSTFSFELKAVFYFTLIECPCSLGGSRLSAGTDSWARLTAAHHLRIRAYQRHTDRL